MKKIGLVLISLVMLLSLTVGVLGCSETEAEVVWKLATYTTEGDSITDICYDFADRVDDLSGGKMEIEVHAADLCSGEDCFDKVSQGVVDMAVAPSSWYFGKMPSTAISLGTTWTLDPDKLLLARKAIVAEFAPAVQESADNNIMHTMWISAGYVDFSFDHEVTSTDGFKNQVIASGSSTVNKILDALGCAPAATEVTDTYLAAETGQVDGAIMPVANYKALGMVDVLPYVFMSKQFPTIFSTLMNADSYEALDAEFQGWVDEAAAEAEANGIEADAVNLEQDLDDIEDEGGHVYTMTSTEMQTFYDNIVWKVFQGTLIYMLGADGYADAQAIVDDAIA